MSFQADLFSSKNIIVPTISVEQNISSNNIKRCITSNNSNNQFEFNYVSSVILSEEQKILSKRFKKYQQKQIYKKSDSCKKTKIKNWTKYSYQKIRSSTSTRNRIKKKNYILDLEKYENYRKYNLPARPPAIPVLHAPPDFTHEYFQKLWDMQEGKDIYTGQKMVINGGLTPFTPSCDRINSDIPYQKGNVVLCCYSTNLGKYKFEVEDWIEYIIGDDADKKREILDRIERIQKLSMD